MKQRLFLLFLLTGVVASFVTAQAAEDAPNNASPPTSKFAKWQTSAENGEPWAEFNLGLAYHLGKETTQNLTEAIKWYRAAAEKGYPPAQANLGYCYDTGAGVTIDHTEAVKWYQMAAIQGHPFAQYNLGKKYQTGPGVSLDPKQAERWFRQAAQQNFVPAYFSLGQIYASELASNPDYKEALKWFRLAAEQGYPAAQHAIGYLYYAGKGVATNYVEAVKWYNLAASRNFADSHYNLAICYERGLGVPQNLIAAVNHYRTAAEFAHPHAQYSLGVCYYEGKGVELDLVQAYKWWNLAAVQGIPEAASSREILARLISETQIKEAQRSAGEFKARLSATAAESFKLLQTAKTDASEIKRVGTGFFITTDGFLVTSYRTLAGGTNIQVVTEGGSFIASLAKADPLNDIALLKVSGAFQPLSVANSREVTPNSEFIAIGLDPQTHGQFNPKAARGKISALLGFQADPRQLSLEPHINTSFGGAAVVNRHGQLVGMLLPDPEEVGGSPDARQNQNSVNSYAIKSDHVMAFLRTSPEVKPILDETKPETELKAEELLSKARAATALILVL